MTDSAPRFRLRALGLLCGVLSVAGGTTLISTASRASNQPQGIPDPGVGAVRLAGRDVSPAALREAARVCRKHPEDLALRTCLERYWVPRFALDAEVQAMKWSERPESSFLIADQLHRALAQRILADQPEPTAENIAAYLADHRRDFEKPLRIRLFRILVDSEVQAQQILAGIGTSLTLAEFRTLARTHSVDRATHERGGDLGFVWPDGTTEVPQVSAEKSLYEAALALRDGELVRAPIPEGKRFAIVLRAGSMPAQAIDAEARQIARLRLLEAATEAELQAILVDAKEHRVKGRDDVLLGKLRRKDAGLFAQ